MTRNRSWNLNDSTCSGVMLMNSRTPPFPEKRPNYLFGRCHCKNNTPEKDAHMEDLLDHDLRQKLIDEKVDIYLNPMSQRPAEGRVLPKM